MGGRPTRPRRYFFGQRGRSPLFAGFAWPGTAGIAAGAGGFFGFLASFPLRFPLGIMVSLIVHERVVRRIRPA